MRESALERYLHREVRKRRGTTLRLLPTVAGMPDRMVLWPDGRADLVELKVPGGKLRKAQILWHERSAERGWPVATLTGKHEVDDWLEETCGQDLPSLQE